MRLLLASDAPWAPSGYGVQSALLLRIVRDLGHDIAQVATFGHHGTIRQWEGFTIFPGGLDGYGNDAIAPAYRQWGADVLLTLKDLWVYNPQQWGPGIRWAPITPVDHDPLPAGIADKIRQFAWQPIAYATFGERKLEEAGFAPLYAPHAVDLATFAPMDRGEARAALGLPQEAFIVGMVAVNRGGVPSRKAWPENLEGFAAFAHQHPDAVLYAHTYDGQEGHEGAYNLRALAQGYGIADRIILPNQEQYRVGFPESYLRAAYASMDVLNAVSVGEGFGIPTLEAQACGTPVIVGDWCASAELLFSGAAIQQENAHSFIDHQYARIFLPSPHAIAEALGAMYARMKAEAPDLRKRARAGALAYGVEAVRDGYWKPVLAALEAKIRQPSRGVLRVVRPESVLAPISAEGSAWAQEASK